jgi:hypothetical protein
VARVAEHYGIPRTIFRDHVNGKIQEKKKKKVLKEYSLKKKRKV